jgi:hypothetical protein
MSDLALFDVELVIEDDWSPGVDMRDDDTAWASCRFCQGLTTAAGIWNRGHGQGSRECARIIAWSEMDT